MQEGDFSTVLKPNMQQGDFSTALECSRDEEIMYFTKLGHSVVQEIQKVLDFSEDKLQAMIGGIIESFKYDKGNTYTDISYADRINQCAYTKRYFTLGAGLARHRVLNAFRNNEELRRKITSPETPDINIISLGSGPGCDVIGLCSALYDIYTESGAYKKIKITLIDSVKSWAKFFGAVEKLTRGGQYGKASLLFQKTSVRTSYFQAHLPEDPNSHREYFSALKEADIVIIRGLFSIIPFPEKPKVSEEIANGIKLGAMVLYIDSPFRTFPGLELIYPENEQTFTDGEDYIFSKPHEIICTESKGKIAVFVKRSEENSKANHGQI